MRTRILLLAVVVLALAAAAPARGATFIALTSTNGVFQFDSASPGSPGPVYPITGLQTNEQIHGIDFRPATGQLYGVGSTSSLYTINPATGQATLVGPLSMPLDGGSFGFDFNPVPDRLRVVSDTNQNIEIHPDTATVTPLPNVMYMGGSPDPYITGTAFSNNTPGATSTTLYAIDTNVLTMINQIDGVITPVGPLSGNPGPITGFDIFGDSGYLAAGQFFDVVNLANGSSAPAGTFPSPLFVKGLAAVPAPGGTPPGGTPDGGNGLPGDFNLDGNVDAADYVLFRKATLNEDGVTVRMQTPAGVVDGSRSELYNTWRANFGRSTGSGASAAQRGRRKRVLFARNTTVLRGRDSMRVRVRLTKAGRRLVRGYERKRLSATLTLRVKYRPASGAATQTRTFKQKVTLRVKRKRR